MAKVEPHKNLIKTLDYYGEKVVKQMKGVLKKRGKRATGNLINSIDYDFESKKGKLSLVVEYASYGKYVDGDPDPRWKKGKGPPVRSIRNWLIAKNIPFKQSKGKKPSRKKQLDIMTFLIIRKIKQRKKLNPLYNNPTNFTKPYDEMIGSKRFKDDIRKAMREDVKAKIRQLNKEIFKK